MLTKLLGFNGCPAVELETLIDTQPFYMIDHEITQALVHSTQLRWGTGGLYDSHDSVAKQFIYPTQMDQLFRKMTSQQRQIFESLADPGQGNNERSLHHNLSQKQRQFLKISCGVYFSWQHNLTVMGANSWSGKYQQSQSIHPETADLLKNTLDYIYSLPFESIGRIVIFGVDPLGIVPTHRDAEPVALERYPEFMNLSPGKYKKKFYVFDNSNQTRIHTKSKAYWFNEFDYHGVDPQPHFTYSMRVDGVFTEEFRRKILDANPGLNLVPDGFKKTGS
jgi:hypothetical protein